MTVYWPITIYCAEDVPRHRPQDAEEPHRVTVDRLVCVDGRWWPLPHRTPSGKRPPSALEVGAPKNVAEDRWRWRCRDCRMTVPARDDKVQAALNYFANVGESEVSLSRLASIISKVNHPA